VEGSEPICITHPEPIASFGDTKVNLNNTEASKSRTDRGVRARIDTGGECIVTKSSSCATAVCGRLGNGEALHLYIVFGSGKTYHPGWELHIDSNLKNMGGHPISWRHARNDEGSLNEEGALVYLKTVLHSAFGSPPPRNDALGKQAIVICDGVRTHIGFSMLEAAVE
jgi:hypothetical protein